MKYEDMLVNHSIKLADGESSMFLFLPLIYLFDRNLTTKIIYESHFFQ